MGGEPEWLAAIALRLREHEAQVARGLANGAADGRRQREGVEHHEVVDGAIISDRGDTNAGFGELPAIGFALVARGRAGVEKSDDLERAAEAGGRDRGDRVAKSRAELLQTLSDANVGLSRKRGTKTLAVTSQMM